MISFVKVQAQSAVELLSPRAGLAQPLVYTAKMGRELVWGVFASPATPWVCSRCVACISRSVENEQ